MALGASRVCDKYAAVAAEAVPAAIEKQAAIKEKTREAGVLCEVRQMNPSLQQQRGWDDLSLTADLARISLYGVSVANGRVTELALVDCGLTGRL